MLSIVPRVVSRRELNELLKVRMRGECGLAEQCDIDDVEPAENAVDDRPEDGMIVGVGDRDRKRRAEADTVFCSLDPDSVVTIAVHV